jgi:hypothetical protein
MSSIPPISLAELTRIGIDPALRLLPPKMDTPGARVLLLAIAQQESDLRDRRQLLAVKDKKTGHIVLRPLGAGKSFWMGEVGGGMVHGVRTHPATKDLARVLYSARQVYPSDNSIWNAIQNDDVLAAGLARLLIYTDPHPLPKLGDVQGGWAMYAERLWRPGKPKPEKWLGCYRRAMEFLAAGQA